MILYIWIPFMNFLCMSFHSCLMLLEAAYIKITGWERAGRRQVKPWDWRTMVSEVGDGWKLVLGGGWLFSLLLGNSSPWWAPLLAAQIQPCALQVWSFTGLLPASVFSGCPSSPLLCDGWTWQSYMLRAGWTHCGQWSEEGKKGWKQCPGTEQSLLQPLSRLSLPTLLYHSPTHPAPPLRLQRSWVQWSSLPCDFQFLINGD